jgi:hypothetical protein
MAHTVRVGGYADLDFPAEGASESALIDSLVRECGNSIAGPNSKCAKVVFDSTARSEPCIPILASTDGVTLNEPAQQGGGGEAAEDGIDVPPSEVWVTLGKR